MERHEHNAISNNAADAGNRKDLEPGRGDRNLLSDNHTEAPVDRDRPMTANVASESGDENYADEELHDPNYFEDRAGEDVRK